MINKNDKLVIFLEEVLGVDVDFWSKRVVWREKTTSIPPLSLTRDQKVNSSYIKRLECEFLCCWYWCYVYIIPYLLQEDKR